MGDDLGVAVGTTSSPRLLIYGAGPWSGDTNVASHVGLAIFVDLHPTGTPVDDWAHSEPVKSGSAQIARAAEDPCGSDFAGSATVVWRDTTIEVTWSAGASGC
jgi:hypothetical protein